MATAARHLQQRKSQQNVAPPIQPLARWLSQLRVLVVLVLAAWAISSWAASSGGDNRIYEFVSTCPVLAQFSAQALKDSCSFTGSVVCNQNDSIIEVNLLNWDLTSCSIPSTWSSPGYTGMEYLTRLTFTNCINVAIDANLTALSQLKTLEITGTYGTGTPAVAWALDPFSRLTGLTSLRITNVGVPGQIINRSDGEDTYYCP
ncbi:hypothetical protein PLESTM_000514100 [Pleodorina starrii]|nr:hypothetical protein PLESTM_000514100 [Pleodorina starrii]